MRSTVDVGLGKIQTHLTISAWQGDRDRCSGKVCETLEEVKEFFGHGWMAKELYYGANIEDVADVE